MLIPVEAFKGGISCTGQKPPCRGLVTRKAMFTLYADYTMTSSSAFKIDCGSMGRLVAPQVRPCQFNLMLLSLID